MRALLLLTALTSPSVAHNGAVAIAVPVEGIVAVAVEAWRHGFLTYGCLRRVSNALFHDDRCSGNLLSSDNRSTAPADTQGVTNQRGLP